MKKAFVLDFFVVVDTFTVLRRHKCNVLQVFSGVKIP